MGCLRFKDGVTLDPQTIAGACIVGALARVAVKLPFDLTVTSGSDGEHSGPDDPHKRGEAYDVRSHDMTPNSKTTVLLSVMAALQQLETSLGVLPGTLETTSGGLASVYFFGFLEHEGNPDEHFHYQLRRGRLLPLLKGGLKA